MTRISEQGRNVRNMFETIAPRYDLLNRVLSLGIDRRWRSAAVRQLQIPPGGTVLDMATGTGDVALEIARQVHPSVTIVGDDFTPGMLRLGRDKIFRTSFRSRISLVTGSCEAIPHPDCSFDGVTIAFGIRNVVNRPLGLQEMLRVLKPGGRAVILEFSTPTNRLVRSLYYLYFRHLLPRIGGFLSRRSAYQYLPDSVLAFPDRPHFAAMMEEAGFRDLRWIDMTGGIVSIFVGTRPN